MKRILPAVIVAGALCFRFSMMAAALRHPERAASGNDERVHVNLAGAMLRGDGFTLNPGPSGPRNITRVPVYPSLVAAARLSAGPRFIGALIVFQNLLALALSAMLFLFVAPRYGRVAAWVALLISLADLPTALFSDLLLTEIPYTFLSLAGMILFTAMREGARPYRAAVLAGAASALAALCRPIHQFVPFLFVFAHAATRRGARAYAGPVALFLCAYAAGIAPWLARNHLVYGKAELTHLGVVEVYLYKAGGALAVAEGRGIEEVKADLERKALDDWGIANINEDPRGRGMIPFAMSTIARHPLAFAVSTLAGFAGNALMPEKGALYGLMGTAAPRLGLLWGGGAGGAAGSAGGGAFGLAGMAFIAFQAALLCGVYALIAWGFAARRIRAGDFIVLISTLMIAYYYLAPAGPEATARFRVPAVPYLCILAAACVGRRAQGGE